MNEINRFPNLSGAPIQAAIFNVRYNYTEKLTIEMAEEICARTEGKFQTIEPLAVVKTHFEFDQEKGPRTSHERNEAAAFKFTTTESNVVGQLDQNGATVTVAPPYINWEHILGYGRSMLEALDESIDIDLYHRFALRYINSIKLPENLRDFHDYLTAPPDPPPRLPQTLIAFSSRIVMPLQEGHGFAIVQQGCEAEQKVVSLDIDCVHIEEIQTLDDQVWNIFEQLRIDKNRIFFESITERTVELCG